VIRIAWRSLSAHKLRTILTVLAVLLGVAMISGTYVLTDQINGAFKNIFADAYKGIDVTIAHKTKFSTDSSATPGLPQAMVDQVKAVPGVAVAAGSVGAQGAVAVNGKVVSTGGSPTLFFSEEPKSLNSSSAYIHGGAPARSGEIGIGESLAKSKKLTVGSRVTVITPDGAHPVSISGIFRFASQSSLGGSILLSTTLADAQRWFNMAGQVTTIDVKAEPGVSSATLAKRIAAALPPVAEVKTGQQAAADQTKQISDLLGSVLRPALLSFGGIAVLVGAFIIFNAFSRTVTQRRREFAMLRALGASRRQVLTSISGEALVMGIAASLLGLFAGLGVAAGVNQLLKAIGVDIPRGGLALAPRTIILALAVGIIITLLSAVVPAFRATRVPPVAALQEGAVLPASRFAKYTRYMAIVVAVLGVLLIVGGMYGAGGTTARLGQIAVGAVLAFVAVAMVSKYFVRPLARAIGWPLQQVSPVSGRLARDNSSRNPGRTAATASALMIGLGVVVFVAVFAQGLKSSFVDSFDRTVRADYVVSSQNFGALPNDVVSRVQSAPGIAVAAGLDTQQIQVNRKSRASLFALNPVEFGRVWQFDWLNGGSDALLGRLGSTGTALLEQQSASSLHLKVGQSFTMETSSGQSARVRVIGLYRDPINLSGVIVGSSTYATLFSQPQLFLVLAKAAPGSSPTATTAAVKAALAGEPTAKVQTATEYKDAAVKQVNQLLALLYALLAMSVIISLFGIVNTLVLSVFERTREIGLLRAIGTSRSQVRATVRYESVITSVIGAIMGIVVGVIFAYVVTSRFASQGITFSIPGVQLVAFLIVGVIVGVIAAILPARRAAKINILDAIHYE
jgi:putative ABC transport system permease protein